MPKPYYTLDEILDVFKINHSIVRSIIKRYKVDTFSNKGKLYIHGKDFYKAYTKHLNPSLFTSTETMSTSWA